MKPDLLGYYGMYIIHQWLSGILPEATVTAASSAAEKGSKFCFDHVGELGLVPDKLRVWCQVWCQVRLEA